MIPQCLTSPPSLKNEFSDGNDKVFPKYKKSETDRDKDNHKRTVVMKNNKNGSEESIVQWKQKNIKDGFVIVDEAQLSKLIKREPIEKYYKLESEPFATGLFASVRRCSSVETGENFAAKFSSRDRYGEDCSAEIYHEIALLSLCGSAPRVIQIHDVFETDKEIIIVMEYAPGGDLQTIIDENLVPFESDVMSFIKQTVEGLEYLHRRRIAHLDIKPQNIVMMGDYPHCEIKLCDFEISRVILEGNDIRELLGTPDYVAPEILHYDPITLAADMWSLGVTTYVLLTGFSPFGGETDQETFCNISRAELDFPEELFKDVSNDAIDFIKSLLVKNPKARLTASACLKHPWLNSTKINSNNIDEVKPVQNNSESPVKEEEIYNKYRNGCDTCNLKQDAVETNHQNAKALRKYLSKSREALFDKVVQKQYNNNNNNNTYNNRKNTIKNHRFRKNRLCESQISLFSKSQEKLLGCGNLNAPSRSIEKLYGLRSLSKSQEVLNLYKNGGILASQENLNMISDLIKSRENLVNEGEIFRDRKLMRATTADLGILHQRHKPSRMYSGSSTTSLASLSNNKEIEDRRSVQIDYSYESNKESEKQNENIKPTTAKNQIQVEQSLNNETVRNSKSTETEDKNKLIEELDKLEERRKSERKLEDGEEDEPRYTVAQLITAYNKHQEIVTKTSLEVTMSAHQKDIKIPPIIPYKSRSQFPTGPTALRFFIPDIDLVEVPKKFTPKYKISDLTDKKSDNNNKAKRWEDSNYNNLPPDNSDHQYLSLNSIISNSSKELNSPTEEEVLSVGLRKEMNKRSQEVSQKCENAEKTNLAKQKRNKSPSVEITKPETHKKVSGSGNDNQKLEGIAKRSPTPNRKVSSSKTVERSPSATRKHLTVEKSPLLPRRSSSRTGKIEDLDQKKSESSQYKIVGIGSRNSNSNREPTGVSYKIEFNSPLVTRKFPIRNLPTKGTISSNLKVKEQTKKKK